MKVEKREETLEEKKRDADREKRCFSKRDRIEEDLLPVSRWKVSKERKKRREKGGELFPKCKEIKGRQSSPSENSGRAEWGQWLEDCTFKWQSQKILC